MMRLEISAEVSVLGRSFERESLEREPLERESLEREPPGRELLEREPPERELLERERELLERELLERRRIDQKPFFVDDEGRRWSPNATVRMLLWECYCEAPMSSSGSSPEAPTGRMLFYLAAL